MRQLFVNNVYSFHLVIAVVFVSLVFAQVFNLCFFRFQCEDFEDVLSLEILRYLQTNKL